MGRPRRRFVSGGRRGGRDAVRGEIIADAGRELPWRGAKPGGRGGSTAAGSREFRRSEREGRSVGRGRRLLPVCPTRVSFRCGVRHESRSTTSRRDVGERRTSGNSLRRRKRRSRHVDRFEGEGRLPAWKTREKRDEKGNWAGRGGRRVRLRGGTTFAALVFSPCSSMSHNQGRWRFPFFSFPQSPAYRDWDGASGWRAAPCGPLWLASCRTLNPADGIDVGRMTAMGSSGRRR